MAARPQGQLIRFPWVCAVRAIAADGKPVDHATGSVVGDGTRVLTVRHVIVSNQTNRPHPRFEVWLPQREAWAPAFLDKDMVSPQVDAAVLRLASPACVTPLRVADPPNDLRRQVRVAGFPASRYKNGRPLLDTIPGVVWDGYGAVGGRDPTFLRLLLTAGHLPPGDADALLAFLKPWVVAYSGAPVLLRSGGAIGTVVQLDTSRIAVNGPALAALGFDTLREHAPEIYFASLPPVGAVAVAALTVADDGSALRQKLVRVTLARTRQLLGAPAEPWSGQALGTGRLSQAAALESCSRLLKPDGPELICVRGPRGIGKSTLAFRLAQQAAQVWQEGGASPLPLLIRASSVEFTNDELAAVRESGTPEHAWDVLIKAWLRFADRVAESIAGPSPSVSHEDLRAALASTPVIIVLDELDDLCARLGITLSKADAMLARVRDRSIAGKRAPPRILVTLREDPLLLPPLPTRFRQALLPIGLMDDDAVASAIGARFTALRGALSSPVGQLLRTPLLVRLIRSLDPMPDLGRGAAAFLAEVARQGFDRGGIDANEQRAKAFAIGYAAYRRLHREPGSDRGFTPSAISETLRVHASESGGALPRAVRTLAASADEVAAVTDADGQPIFTSLPDGRRAFTHSLWADLTVAGYLAQEIDNGSSHALAATTFAGLIFDFAAELLLAAAPAPEEIERTLRKALEAAVRLPAHRRAANSANEFRLGNLAVILGLRAVPLTHGAWQKLADAFPRLPPLARHVILSVLAGRAIGRFPGETQADLHAVLQTLIAQTLESAQAPWATRSLAALTWRCVFPNEPPQSAWPQPREQDLSAIVRLAGGDQSNKPEQIERRSTLQLGYVQTVLAIPAAPRRMLSALHYLIFAVVLQTRSTLYTSALREGLGAIFDAGTNGTARVRDRLRDPLIAAAKQHQIAAEAEALLDVAERLYAGKQLAA
jgi:hypothetical protein